MKKKWLKNIMKLDVQQLKCGSGGDSDYRDALMSESCPVSMHTCYKWFADIMCVKKLRFQ